MNAAHFGRSTVSYASVQCFRIVYVTGAGAGLAYPSPIAIASSRILNRNQRENVIEPDEASVLIEVEVRNGVLWMLKSINLCAGYICAGVGIGHRLGAGWAIKWRDMSFW